MRDTDGQLLGQFDDHVLQIFLQTLKLLVGRLEEVRTSAGEEAESSPSIIRVPHHPEHTEYVNRMMTSPSVRNSPDLKIDRAKAGRGKEREMNECVYLY